MRLGTHDGLMQRLANAIAASPHMPVVLLPDELRDVARAAVDAFRVILDAAALLSPSPAERAVIEKGRQVVESDPRYRVAETLWRRERPRRAPRYVVETWALLWDGDRSVAVGWRRIP